MAILLLTGCRHEEFEMPGEMAPAGERVELSFKVAVPSDGTDTKAMGINPTIDTDGFYIAVFGGSGYFNEWVKATVQAATANYDGTNSTVYTITASLTVSDSRLRLHFIANCPPSIRTSPPISGSSDTEEYVMSHIRTQLTDTYNDGYWQKVILPNGVRATKNAQGVYVATTATLNQLPNPIIMVRNFARVYLRNLTPIVGETGNGHQLVKIKKFGLAYAPAEGVIAPILSAPYMSSTTGSPITVAEDDETTAVYYENFLMNYQRYPIISDEPADTLVTAAPFNYGGFSPSDQSYDYYAAEGHTDRGTPLLSDLKTWNNEDDEENVLFVYERTIPSSARRATRIIIQAERIDQNDVSEGDRFYALDIVNTEGVAIPLLRNQTYTVHLLNIESGSGETDISKASQATSATVSGDPNFQNLVNISDGKSSIGTSFTEKFYVQPQLDFVMFRYLPTNIGDETYAANVEGNELVTFKVGSFNTETGVFTELTPAQATSQGILAFKTEGGEYKVWIEKDQNDKTISFVRSNNAWVAATAAQIADPTIEKWGMVKFELNASYKDSDNYFTEERTQTIRIIGSYDDREMSRDVIIKTSPRQSMQVNCLQKYVMGAAGEEEVVRIMIPTGLSRSVFPLEFTIEADGYSLTPDGDVLPVTYGTSTVPGVDTPAYYFVKTVTQEQYNSLPTTKVNGVTWKYIDCHFKTTIAQNACTVYVQSHFFNDDAAYDEFYNFVQRLFTNQSGGSLSLPNTIYRNGEVTFSFSLDYAHRNNTVVWWDPTNYYGQSGSADEALERGLSTSNRVLPPIMSVTLNGFTPKYREDGVTPVTAGLEHSTGNTYIYYVGSGEPTSDKANISLALTPTGAVGSTGTVTLSTANIEENPDLYITASASRTISGSSFSGMSFSPSTLPLGLNQTTTFNFSYQAGVIEPVTITLSGLTLNGTDSRMTNNGNGIWTFTPNNTNAQQSISLKSTTRFSAGSVTLEAVDYASSGAQTISRPTSFVLNSGSSLSAGIGRPNGDGVYVNAYYTDTYTDTYVVSGRNAMNNRTYRTRFTNNGSYTSRDDITIDLTKYGDSVENGVVYFYYSDNDTNGYNGVHYASVSLATLYDTVMVNGQRVTLNFQPVGIGTTNARFSTSNRTYTNDGVTVSFTNLTGVNANYVVVGNNATVTVSVEDGYHISDIKFSYRTSDYYPKTVTIVSGGGSYSGTTTGTWTSDNNTTKSVQLRMTKRDYYENRMTQVVVTVVED